MRISTISATEIHSKSTETKRGPKLAHLLATTALVAGMSVACSAGAETVTWDGSNSTNWDTNNNWTSTNPPNKPPAAGDDAVLDDGAIANQPTLGSATPQLLSTTVSDGTLTISAGGSLVSTTVAISGTGEIVNQGNITGTVSVTDATLTQAGGTLTGGLSLAGTGTLASTTTGTIGALTIAANANATITAAAGTTLTQTGSFLDVSPSGSLTFGSATDTGRVVITANGGSYSSGFSIDVAGGTLAAAGSQFATVLTNINNTNVFAGAALDINAVNTVVNRLNGAGTVTNSGAADRTLSLRNSSTFGGVIEDGTTNAISLVKIAGGTTTLTGANTYTGSTQVDGLLQLTSTGSILNTGSITISSGGTLHLDNDSDNAVSDEQVIALSGTGILRLAGNERVGGVSSGDATTGIELQANTTLSIGPPVSAPGAQTFAGSVSGSGGITLVAGGVQVPDLTLSGTNTYSGTTTLSGGTLRLTGGSAIGDSSAVVMNGGNLTVAGTETIGAFSGASGGASNFAVNITGELITSAADTAARTYSSGLAGAGTFTKGGTDDLTLSGQVTVANVGVTGGTLQLSNTSNTMTAININGGELEIGANGTTNSVAITTGATAAVEVIGSVTNNSAITATTNTDLTLEVAGGTTATLSGAISTGAAGSITRTGTGTLNLTGANTINTLNVNSGATTVSAGSVALGAVDGGSLTIGGTAAITAATINNGTLTLNGGAAGLTSVTVGDGTAGPGTDRLVINTALTGGTTITTQGSVITYGADSAALIALNSDNTQLEVTAGTFTQSGVISDDNNLRPLEKIGAGELILSGTNTYGDNGVGAAQGTTVTAGRLNITGSILSNTVSVAAGAGLTLNNAAGAVKDTAAIILNGAAADLTLGASETVGSVTAADANSTVQLGANTLTVAGAGTSSVAGEISGTGALVKQGAGDLTLSGTNTYSGDTTISGGAIVANSAAALGATTSDLLLDGGTLTTSTGASLTKDEIRMTQSSTLAAAAAQTLALTTPTLRLQPAAAGTLSFGTALQTGTVQINGSAFATNANASVALNFGTLQIGNAATGAGLLSAISGTMIGANGTLDINGHATDVAALTGTGTVTNSGGTADLRTSGTTNFGGVIQNGAGATGLNVIGGTTTLTGANTYTGATLLSGGDLTLSGGGSLTSTDVTINATRTLTTQGGLATGTVLVNNGSLVLTGSDEIGSIAGAGAVNLNANTLTVGGLDTSTALSGVVSGTGNLIKTGTGTLTLSANNTADNLTIHDGTLLLSGDNSAVDLITVGGGGVGEVGRLRLESDLAGGQKITTLGSVISYGDGITMATPIELNSDDTQLEVVLAGEAATQSGIISEIGGARPIEKIGAGTLTLSADNTYTGTTTVTAGTLNVTGSIASGSVVVEDTASLVVDGASLADAAAVILNDSGNLTVNTAAETIGSLNATNAASTVVLNAGLIVGDATDTTVAGEISGAGGLTKTGAGTLALTGTNTYTGTTTISDGTLSIDNASALGGAAGPVVLNGGTLLATGTMTLNKGTLNVLADSTISVAAGEVVTSAPYISQSAGTTLTFGGTGNTGTFVLASTGGAVDNTARTAVAAGTLQVGSAGLGLGYFTALDGTSVASGAFLDIGGFDTTIEELTGAGTISNSGAEATLSTTEVTNFSGDISGAGGVINLNVSNGTTTLTGANTYTGSTTLSGGDLTLSGGGSLTSTDVTINATRTLTTQGGLATGTALINDGFLVLTGSEEIGSIAGAGEVNLNANSLTVGGLDTSTALSGVVSGTGTLIKTGTGTLTLSADNTYTGTTTVTAGTLNVTGSIASAAVVVETAGALGVDGASLLDTASVTLNGAGAMNLTGSETIGSLTGSATSSVNLNANTLTVGDGNNTAMDGVISGVGGALTKTGSGTLTLSNTNVYDGVTTVTDGLLDITGSILSAAVNIDGTGSVQVDGASLLDVATVTLTGSGDLSLTGDETIGAVSSLSADATVQLNGNTLSLNANADQTFAGVISGTPPGIADFSLVKNGIGNLILTGQNTFTGQLVLGGGTLTLNNAGGDALADTLIINTVGGTTIDLQTDETIGILNGGADVTLGANTLTFNDAGVAATHTGIISGSGGLTNAGAFQGLSGTNTYIGTTTVTSGTLTLANGAAIIDSGAVVVNGGVLSLNDSETIGSLAGTGGTVELGANTLTTGDGTDTSYAGIISGANGALVKEGAGTFTLTGANTYSGATTVNAGTLALTGAGAINSSVATIAAGATLASDGGALLASVVIDNQGALSLTGSEFVASVSGAGAIALNGASTDLTLNAGASNISGIISGEGGLNVTGTSLTTLSAANTYTGGTTISGGELIVAAGGTLGAVTGSTMISGGTLTVNTDVTQSTVTQSGGAIGGSGTLTATDSFTHLGVTIDGTVVTPVFSMTDGIISSTGTVTASNTSLLAGTNAIDGTLSGDSTGTTTVASGTTTLGATGEIIDMASLQVASGAALTTGGAQQIDDATIVTVDGTLTLGGAETLSGLNGVATGVVNTGGNTLTLGTTGGSFAGAINGTGALVVSGGTQTLTGSNGYSGATDVIGGTLSVTGAGTLASTDLETTAGATLGADGGALQSAAVITNAGTLALTGNESVASVSGAGAVGLNGGDLTLNAGASNIAGVISGTGGLNVAGSSISTLSGANTFTGDTVVDATLTVAATGALAGSTIVNASGTLNNAGTVQAIDNAGTLTNTGTAGAVTNSATATNSGTVASLDQQAGSFTNSGTISGDADIAAGTLDHSGTVGGNVTIATGATANVSGGTVTGTTTNNGGALNIDGGTFTGTVSNASGTLTAAGTVSGAIENAGTMTVTAPDALDLTGTIINTGTGLFTTTGTVATSGGLTNEGTLNAEGALNSAVTNNATFNVTGPLTATGQDVTNTASLNIGANSYTGIGTLTNGPGAVVGLSAGGTLGTTTLTNNGIVNANSATVSGALTNNLTFNAQGAAISGSVTNGTAGTFDLTGGSVTGPVNNAGTFTLTNGSVSGVFTNSGSVTALGNTSIGGLVGTGSGSISLLTPDIGGVPQFDIATKDRLTINGDVNGGIFALDVNIGSELGVGGGGAPLNPNGGTSDLITVTGHLSGDLHFDFVNKVPAGVGPFLGDSILVLDGAFATDTVNLTNSGLGAGGAVVYTLAKVDDDLKIVSETSAGIGGVAANASLVQSLIGTVVNRPTSPFVSGLATEEGCSRGGYFRGTYGVSTVSGTSNNGVSTTSSKVEASYAGAQGGYDFGCNDGRFFDGWDGSFGALVGYNTGKSDQNVSVGVSGGGTAVASITRSKFDQKYIGVYTAFAKDRITADVQLRFEKTNFTLNETVLPGFFGLGLADAKFSTSSTNVTGRVSYRMDLNEDGLNFVPTAGLSYTHTSDAMVNFTGGETLRIDAFDSIVGFIGGTVAKTKISPEGNAGTTYFGSANYYHDFAGDRKSLFTDALGGTQAITTKNIGGFGELSMGVNYVRILDNGPGGAKQLNANVRLDTRFGSNVKKSASITAQVRLSF